MTAPVINQVVDLDDAERELVGGIVRLNAIGLGEGLERASTLEEAQAAVVGAQRYLDMLPASFTGTLEATPSIVAKLEQYRDDIEQDIARVLEQMSRLRAGDEGARYVDSFPESLTIAAGELRRAVDEMAACDSLLAKVVAAP